MAKYKVIKKFLGGYEKGFYLELDIDLMTWEEKASMQFLLDSGYIEESNGKWKPEWGHEYWIVDTFGDVAGSTYSSSVDELRFGFNNCFRTKEEAEHARDLIREALKGI